MPKLASKKYCTGCLACMDACKHNAIIKVFRNGLPFVEVNPDQCMDCGLCEKACPIMTPVRKNRLEEMKVYGG